MRTSALVALLTLSVALAATPPRPGEVKGTVLDAKGRPLPGAIIWLLPSISGNFGYTSSSNLVKARTDAKGQYSVKPLPDLLFGATAWVKVPYQGESFCLRLAAENNAQYEPFSPKGGVIRNFRLKINGPVPDTDIANTYFGAEVRLMTMTWEGADDVVPLHTSKVEVTLTPNGPLIDGSTGKTIVKVTKPGENFLYDIPVGRYTVTAAEIQPNGTRTPVLVTRDYTVDKGFKTTLTFKPNSELCGGAPGTTSFVERAILYVARPTR